MRKKRVLLNWDSSRKDLLEPFIALKDELEFIIIWGENDDAANHPFKQIYYSEYRTAYDLLNDIQPDKVLFFNINSFPQVAVSLAARNKKIPRYIMHHGIHHSDNLEINLQKEKQGIHKARKAVSNRSSLFFYLSALKLKNIDQVFPMLRFAWLRQKRDRTIAISRSVFKARLPDFYINLSPHNAIITRIIDRLKTDENFKYIGHPFFDSILQELNKAKDLREGGKGKYFLLIDFPNKEDVLDFRLMTGEKKQQFYKDLSAIAASMGCRLKIKLHPFGYNSPWNYQDENIDLIEDADIAELIHDAEKCFSFFSTLIIPIIYNKGFCYVFHIGKDRNLQKELVELGVAIKLETSQISPEIINGSAPDISEEAYNTFVHRYLYYTDGKATQRLKDILQSDEAV